VRFAVQGLNLRKLRVLILRQDPVQGYGEQSVPIYYHIAYDDVGLAAVNNRGDVLYMYRSHLSVAPS
jgi:hypothetical protein